MRIRPYKPCDGDTVASWLGDEKIFNMWCAGKYEFPMSGEQMNKRYDEKRNDTSEFMMTAIGDDGKPIGYFLLRNADWNAKSIHIGFIVVDSSKRHSGYGKQMVKLAIRYCFDILGMERITLGVFHVNSRAMNCYEAIGFTPYGMEETFLYKGREWKIIEMEYLKSYE